jgi:hypothetical protein
MDGQSLPHFLNELCRIGGDRVGAGNGFAVSNFRARTRARAIACCVAPEVWRQCPSK